MQLQCESSLLAKEVNKQTASGEKMMVTLKTVHYEPSIIVATGTSAKGFMEKKKENRLVFHYVLLSLWLFCIIIEKGKEQPL